MAMYIKSHSRNTLGCQELENCIQDINVPLLQLNLPSHQPEGCSLQQELGNSIKKSMHVDVGLQSATLN